jgi:hypothetical protein
MVDRFNLLNAEAQEQDAAVHRALSNLPSPIEMQVSNSLILQGAEESPLSGEPNHAKIKLRSGACALTVIAKSQRVEAQIRNE